MIHKLLTILATGLYFAAGVGLTARLARCPIGDRMRTLSLGAATMAVIAHAFVLWHTVLNGHGLSLGFFNAASLIGFLMAALLLLANLFRPLANLGVIILPLAGLAALLSFFFGGLGSAREPIGSEVDLHILLSVLAYSTLGIAAVQALLLAVQEHQLRHRRPGGFVSTLPPLQTMEDLLFRILRLGFFILTLALLSGLFFVHDLFAQHLVHKTVLSIVAWVVFGVLLWGRARFGWRGQTAIRWTLGGFVLLALAYFGSKLVLELIIGR
ncbi:MAG: cytochrome c biogenesis protein CcsA [Ectothiorhodospiraceae bacterium]|jgi:ABC-type uncharacterized transport system permease subunit